MPEPRWRRALPPAFLLHIDEGRWPDDINDQVFLGRAINAIGRAIYSDEWVGDERNSPNHLLELPGTPTAASAAQHTIEYAACILKRFDPTAFEKYSNLFNEDGEWLGDGHDENSDDSITNDLPPEFWRRATDLRIHDETILRNRHRRWHGVQLAMLNLLRGGSLKASARSSQQGRFKELDPNVWNVENLWWRFESCTIDPKRPFDQQISEPSRVHFLYVEKQGLNVAAAGASSNPVTPERYDAFSPYLKLAIQVAIDRQRNPESLGWKKIVDAHIRTQWPLSSKPSKNVIDAISYVVRDPDTRPDEERGYHVKEVAKNSRAKQNPRLEPS